MKMFNAIKKGAVKSASAYSYLIVMWIITLVLIWIVAAQLKTEFKGAFGASMLRDALTGGFDLEVAGDMGSAMARIMAQLVSGTGFLLLLSLALYSFFAGGLFSRFTTGFGSFRVSDYFKSSAHYFFAFLGVGIIMLLLIVLWTLIAIILPVTISGASENGTQALASLMLPLIIIWFLGLPVLLLVADHARRWMTTTGTRRIFTAIGAGIQSAFKGFLKSYSSVLIILIINAVVSFLTVKFVFGTVPEKGGTIFLFFIATQIIYLLKLWIKAWRYATVTELVALPGQE